MMNNKTTVQVSDTTMLNSSSEATQKSLLILATGLSIMNALFTIVKLA